MAARPEYAGIEEAGGLARRAGIRPGLVLPACFALLLGSSAALAAQPVAEVTGRVRIGLAAGTIAGDVCIAGLPPRDMVSFVLNRSLEVRQVRGGRRVPSLTRAEPGGGAVRHTVVRTRQEGGLEESGPLCVRYAGSETVHDPAAGRYREDDSSHVIAFSGTALRARGAARWYPAPFDPTTGLADEAHRYRVTIECAECEWIYMNGNSPRPGPVATFASGTPRELFLLAGELPVDRVNGTLILGERVESDSAQAFLGWLERIRRAQEEFVGVPFGDDLVIARIDPVREPRRGLIWGFYSDPTLTLTGMRIPEFLDVLEGARARAKREVLGFLAHEMAHRYFGWRLGWESPQRELFGEPFATYLELKTVRALLGTDAYRAAVAALVERGTSGSGWTPLGEARAEDFDVEEYRYGHAPLQLFALESVIGEAAMRTLLHDLITAPAAERAAADFSFLRRKALESGVRAEAWSEWEERCLSASGQGECFEAIGGDGQR